MKKKLFIGVLFIAFLFFVIACASGRENIPNSIQTAARDITGPDPIGNLLFVNVSGEELAVYVDKVYVRTIRGGRTLINIDYAEDRGTPVEIYTYYRSKIKDLGIVPEDDALYLPFTTVLRPATSAPPKKEITIPELNNDLKATYAAGAGAVLVTFKYPHEDPRLMVSADIFIGSAGQRNRIAALSQNEEITVPLPRPSANFYRI